MLDDIVAVITPPGIGAVSGIRISGAGAIDIARQVFPSLSQSPTSHLALVGTFAHGDTGVLIPYLAPRSYTGENTAECFIHGSPASVSLLMARCIEAGARPAKEGEFTLRAFLNGKLDLTQAEAIPELAEGSSRVVIESAASQLHGALKGKVEDLIAGLEVILTSIEAWVDFSEEIGDLETDSLAASLRLRRDSLAELIRWASLAPRAREGSKAVIVGPPNSGKSTLFNALMQSSRAIVTDIPGTTRDVLIGSMMLEGTRIELLDTAGLRETSDPVESIGIAKAREEAASAQVILLLADLTSSQPPAPLDELFPESVPVIRVGTKADAPRQAENALLFDVLISAVTGEGMSRLAALIRKAVEQEVQVLPFLANERQNQLLHQASKSLESAELALTEDLPLDLLSTCLRDAISALRHIIGQSASAESLEAIFSKFCIGK